MIKNNKSLQRFISLTVINSTEQCLCWEGKSHTGTQEMFHLLWDPEGSLLHARQIYVSRAKLIKKIFPSNIL